MKSLGLSLVLLCFVALGGCATGNRGERGEICSADGNHSHAIHGKSLEKNKFGFGTEALIGVVDLDLAMLVDIALENNPATKRSWHLARLARAQVGQANSTFFPTVTLGGQIARSESNAASSGAARQETLATTFHPSLEIHYSLFQFGAGKAVAEAAKQALCAANCQYDRTIQGVIHGVQRAYFALCSAESTVASNEHNLNDAAAAYEAAFMRHQSGLVSIQEYLQAKANKSQAEFELEQSCAGVETARAALAKAVGIKVSRAIRVLPPAIATNAADMDRAMDGIMGNIARKCPGAAAAYANVSATLRISNPAEVADMDRAIDDFLGKIVCLRPDVAAAGANVRAREHLSRSTRAKMLPEFIIGGSGNVKKYSHRSDSFNNFNLFAGITWKIFDGLKNFYDIAEVRENLEIARQELRAAKLSAQTEIWTNYFAFKSANKQLQAARILEQSAGEAFEATGIAFANGLCKFTDLVSAQTCLANARRQRVVSENNLLTSLADLAYSVGGVADFDLTKNR